MLKKPILDVSLKIPMPIIEISSTQVFKRGLGKSMIHMLNLRFCDSFGILGTFYEQWYQFWGPKLSFSTLNLKPKSEILMNFEKPRKYAHIAL